MQNSAIQSLLRIKEVERAVGLSRASIYRLINAGDFPVQIKLSERASAWCSDDIDLWQQEKIQKSIGRSAWHAERGRNISSPLAN
jgi:prophage regulatory protein